MDLKLKCSLQLFINLRKVCGGIHITELLGFRNKSIPAGDLNAKHPVWNSKVSNPSGLKFSKLFDSSNFEMSAPQFSTHYTSDGRGDVSRHCGTSERPSVRGHGH
jgi:hypothetical protein